jgi:hypothetical protein
MKWLPCDPPAGIDGEWEQCYCWQTFERWYRRKPCQNTKGLIGAAFSPRSYPLPQHSRSPGLL